MKTVSSSILEVIGRTPLIELSRISRECDGRILAKLECYNPGGSKKDRAALQIIKDAKESGRLSPGQPVVELTSGNMGAGLSIVCSALGHPFHAVISKGNSPERSVMMSAYGATIHIVDQAPGAKMGEVRGVDIALVREEALRLTKTLDAFYVDQFNNRSNADAYYNTLAPEMWAQSGGAIDAFCDFVGSGGSFAGCSRYLLEQNPSIKTYIVEPEGAAVLSGEAALKPDHVIQGGGYAMNELSLLGECRPHGYLKVAGDVARSTTQRLAKEEGIFAGFSAGANVAAALQLLAGPMCGKTVAVIICDTGLKYLSTSLWSERGH